LSEETETEAPPPPQRKRRWLRRIAALLATLLALIAAAALLLDTGVGHRFVADQIAALRPSNGLRFQVGRIDGSIYGKVVLVDLKVSDPKGLVFTSPRVALDWRPSAWLWNKLEIHRVAAARATLAKLPELRPGKPGGPILPGFDIHVGELAIDRLSVAPAVTGVAREGRVHASADIRKGRAILSVDALVQGSDTLRLRLDAEPDHDKFDIDLVAKSIASGVLARATGLGKPLDAQIHGNGSWTRWQGRAQADVAGVRIVELALANAKGSYTLGGMVAPGTITRGKLQRLTAPRVDVEGAATLADRRLTGRLSLRSPEITVESEGMLDLRYSAYRDVRMHARLLKPPALFPNMTGRNIDLRVVLDGPFSGGHFQYLLAGDHVQFDNTGFERVRAGGQGRITGFPFKLPVRLTAAEVTGVGQVAGGILRNLLVDGVLDVTKTMVTGNNLLVRSDKLNGRLMLTLDLRTGDFEVGLSGGLKRYFIPGIGLVDVDSRLTVVPGAGRHGTHVVGVGTAQVVRFDNAFFRNLAGGLPKLITRLDRGPDRIMHFNELVLTAPLIRITGNGYRRTDGTFHFEGSGTQQRYGPFTLRLDGRIERPTIDLKFAHPNDAMGLADVVAHLDPTPEGFALKAEGQSRLGHFSGDGAILLPPGGQASIRIDRLDVADSRATGTLAIVEGGFDGRINVGNGAIAGTLDFKPQNGVQRIDGHLRGQDADLGQGLRVRRGTADFALLLDPNATTIDATVNAQGVRYNDVAFARLVAHARLVNGEGDATASLAGARGRGFAIQSSIHVTPDRYVIAASGTVARREIALAAPAVLRREGDGWRLEPARLRFAGGEAEIGGSFGDSTAIDASMRAMPLALLDIVSPGLALGGTASGKLHYASAPGAAPTGTIDVNVHGLTRSGLVLSSTPIDMALAGVLRPDRAGLRAVMASGGHTIGRAQAQISPLGSGGLAERLRHGGLFAQLRYDGPADTLWRLTGLELLDVTGRVAIGADVGGQLANPQIRGSLRTTDARMESPVTGMVLTGINAAGRFDGSRLVVDRFAARDRGTGTVSGTGNFDFAAAHGFGIDLSFDTHGVQIIDRDDIAATVTGPLRIQSDGSGGTISGDVRVDRSRYRLGRAVAAAPIPRFQVREINRPEQDFVDEGPLRPWQLDVHARAPGDMRVTGLGLTSEWSADLAIAGDPTNPRITGSANLVRGDYEFAGREFQLSRGVIRFDGSVPANPALDIAADADTQGINATIRVTGTSDRPEINFASIPALPQDELLSRLLFGTSITNLSAPEALQLAAAVAALQNGDKGLNPINAVRRAAGLDRLRFLPADPTAGNATAVAAGKYVTHNLYAEIVTDGQGYSATRVEFQMTRWLSLLSSISTLGRQSVNVRVSKDY